MITEFKIANFKSIEKLNIELGRVNVFIGENGCGKSNILEAITLASAATQNKLDNEFLATRGIRVTAPHLMKSAFKKENTGQPIQLEFKPDGSENIGFLLTNNNEDFSGWVSRLSQETQDQIDKILELYTFKRNGETIEINSRDWGINSPSMDFFKQIIKQDFLHKIPFENFLIYSPENTSLRTFEKEGQIEPLGINGEGLFKLIKFFAKEPELKSLTELKEYLHLFDWFKDFTIPGDLFEGESHLQIKDRYLDPAIKFFDQKSTNEGFLFILFYISLFISDKTPDFFAIDNIESSLNPKLCTKLVKCLGELSKKHHKQVILTTHNPAILDGLNLNDDSQRLFLIYRNKIGNTIAKRIHKPQPLEGQEPVKLSEAFLRGYLGGLPKNFSL